MHDELGNRIKDQYEDRTRYFLPRRTYTIIRVDGKAFHTLTKNCPRPFDPLLMSTMDMVAQDLCKEIQGAKLAYVQSDEISILLTDFETIHTDAWFDGNIQKIVSVAASIATKSFNANSHMTTQAAFDARVFTIPDPVEVSNYFVWRQQDAVRNSIQMAARAVFSHKECNDKNVNELQEMMFQQKQINWNNYSAGEKRGRVILKEYYDHPDAMIPNATVSRSRWAARGAPSFTQEKEFLKTLIPVVGQEDK